MHEMAIATTLIGQVLHQAEVNRLTRVERIDLDIGVQRLVVPEALHMAFKVVAVGTPAAGAELNLREVPAWCRCRACDAEFAPAIDDYRCPTCGQADVCFLQGDDIILAAMTGDSEEEDEA